MRLFLLTSLTMIAFAANSVLNRLALVDGAAGPASFAALRLASGAAALAIFVLWRSGRLRLRAPGRVTGVWSLALYVLGFSFAYVTLDAGVGALILFGGVQITMFAGALIAREPVPVLRWVGSSLALAGLVWLLWPGDSAAPPIAGALMMAAAAFGWGIYSLTGRGARDPLGATAANFVLAAPLGLAVVALWPDALGPAGVLLAVISGVVTSGLGYALWYTVLPRLDASVAAVSQLTVPVIALAGGALLLAEPVTLRFVIASGLVLGGVAVSTLGPRLISARSARAGRS